jgi:thiol-disulfide isomerase/thioredoxin
MLKALLPLMLAAAAFAAGPVIPRPSGEFVYELPGGQQQLLTSYRGKVVMLELLLTTCPHCQNASRISEKLFKEFGARGFQPLGIAVNDMAKMLAEDYKRGLGLSFPIGYARRESIYPFLQVPLTENLFYPIVVFIDRKGMIRAQHVGGADFFKDEERNMRNTIEMLLNEKSGAKPAAKPTRSAAAKKAS